MSLDGFTAEQVAHIAATTLDAYVKGPLNQIGIQEKPLIGIIEGAAKEYNGAKENISIGVKFERGAGGVNDGLTGYSNDDEVNFYTPGNGKRANYIWREHHIGFTMTETMLKTQGILIGDEFGKVRRSKGDRGLQVLANIMDEATKDFGERYAETVNTLFWGDGTSDSSALHGLRAFIQDIPTLGAVGGLSGATNPKWRNRSRTAAYAAHGTFDPAWGGNRVTSAVADGGALLQELQKEWRQLRRFGGKPDTFLAGSSFIDAMEREIRANGMYSDIGFTKKQDGAVGEMYFKNVPVIYDPTLDDLGRAKYAYIWDKSDIYLESLAGDWKRTRNPARPFNKFVFYESLVCTGQMCSEQRDSALVIEIA